MFLDDLSEETYFDYFSYPSFAEYKEKHVDVLANDDAHFSDEFAFASLCSSYHHIYATKESVHNTPKYTGFHLR